MVDRSIPSSAQMALSATDGLFGKVTPNIRRISCEMRKYKLHIQIVYDRSPSEEEEELFSLFETYMIANLSEFF